MPDLIIGSQPSEREQLPASRDRAGGVDSPTVNNPSNASPTAVTTSTPEDEALIGAYPYSGADIKLVVHLPPEDPRASARTESEINEELQQAIEERDGASSGEEQTAQMEGNLNALRQIETQKIQEAEQLPNGSEEQIALEQEILIVREEMADLSNRLSSVRANIASVEELDQRVSDLRSQLDAIQQSTPSPPTSRTRVLAEIQTLSLSSHREKYPVRTLGTVFLRSVTRGPRTVSGSVVFTTFHSHVMQEFLESTQYRSTGVGDWDRFAYSSALMDQIPPLDISVSFANEYGNLSWMAILGVEFINEGMVMSIEDLFMEGTAQYIARDFDPIRSVANRRMTMNRGVGQSLSGTRLMAEDLRRRQNLRNLPWI